MQMGRQRELGEGGISPGKQGGGDYTKWEWGTPKGNKGRQIWDKGLGRVQIHPKSQHQTPGIKWEGTRENVGEGMVGRFQRPISNGKWEGEWEWGIECQVWGKGKATRRINVKWGRKEGNQIPKWDKAGQGQMFKGKGNGREGSCGERVGNKKCNKLEENGVGTQVCVWEW